jgi:aryl-alcohol dehydrogenase-like predicted oxidoreductase
MLTDQFYERSMSPHRWCTNHGYNYFLWSQLASGRLTASRGKVKRMREELEAEGFNFDYLQSEEIVKMRRAYYELKGAS